MSLLHASDLSLSFGSRSLLRGATIGVEEGERVGLVGVNGSGKSTLLRILAGEMQPDAGRIQVRRGTRITYLPQEPRFPDGATVASELEVAQAPLRKALAAYEAASAAITESASEAELQRLADLSAEVERLGGWNTEHEARRLLDKLGVDAWEAPIARLSGGLRKRVAIAQALLSRPDLLLLDEPTNHLDADTVEWLEEALDELPGALVLVTHDRYFLDGLVDRIVEFEDGALISYPGNYEAYLEQKLVRMEALEVQERKRQRWIAGEVAWLRKGVEARRTKSRARIERARKLMAARGYERPKVAALQAAEAPRLGGTVIEAEGVAKRFGDKEVLRDVSLILRAGERVGIVGPNGAGKTTLLRILLGELEPDAGEVVQGKSTRIAYYDQHRAVLDEEQTVYEAAWDDDWVTLGDRRVALRDYLTELLFPVPMQRMRVKALSGGERNRLLLARLFLQGANVLVLDEPTNDLDIVTLNLLESLLVGFGGTVLLVTHDRYFLDKVATSILAVEGDGEVVRYEGNYATYRVLKAQAEAEVARAEPVKAQAAPRQVPARPKPEGKRRLSFKEKRELEGMEEAILAAEARQEELEAVLADPETYAKRGEEVGPLTAELEAARKEVERLYERWQELQSLES